MKRSAALLAALAIGLAILSQGTGAGSSGPATVLKAETMAGVTGPYVGAAGTAIRGVHGGGIPWAIDEAKVDLGADGRLTVKVEGLVLASGPSAGTNPITQFRAVVSCETIDGAGAATTSNVSTDPFPANGAGDSKIEADLSLPSPCFAPVVFVTSPTGAWFATTGL
jgi:hypothetical protein